MLGFLRPKPVRLAYAIERELMKLEMAYEQSDWPAFIKFGKRYEQLLGELLLTGEWDEKRLTEFLKSRGLSKSYSVAGYFERMTDAQAKAGARFM